MDASDATVLTYPADWGQQRRAVLKEAARLAGIGNALLVDEPVAAGRYCVDVLNQQVPPGRSLVIFDFGGGTLDLAVVRREPDGLRVLATGGLDDLGGPMSYNHYNTGWAWAFDTPFPYKLEHEYLPDANRILDAVERVVTF